MNALPTAKPTTWPARFFGRLDSVKITDKTAQERVGSKPPMGRTGFRGPLGVGDD